MQKSQAIARLIFILLSVLLASLSLVLMQKQSKSILHKDQHEKNQENSNNILLTQRCIDVLPYRTTNINHTLYASWYGKSGQNINGTSYESGHVFSRHVAINYQCTSEQKKEGKTVFYDQNEFYKIFPKDNTNCTMTSQKQFNFRQTHYIASASDYIKGIDCTTGSVHLFSSYFAEFKRAIQNPRPTQEQYMASKYATIITFYPRR